MSESPPRIEESAAVNFDDRIEQLIGSLTMPESGRHNMPQGQVSLRDYPFPFKGVVSVTAGVTGMTARACRTFLNYFAREGDDAPAAELEVSAAFGFDTETDRLSFGHRDGGSGSPEAEEEQVAELVRCGALDTIRCVSGHRDWERAQERLQVLGLSPRIAIDTPSGLPGASFRSDDSLLERYKFGDHLDYRIKPDFRNKLHAYLWEQWAHEAHAGQTELVARFNRTIQTPVGGEDATLPFKRYAGPMRGTATTLPALLNAHDLDWLVYWRGAALVDFEPALWSIVGRTPDRDETRNIDDPLADYHQRACWTDIENRQAKGELLVMPPHRLLGWLRLRQVLKLEVERAEDRWTVRMACDPADTDYSALAENGFDGLALVVPSDAPEIEVLPQGADHPIEMIREKDPTLVNLDCLYRTWRPLRSGLTG
ncbi:MAG: hypothetical protein ACMVY4_11465 [Minwuia sp.]|uniref:hypothetical protein n=1 Tax=Minwuia sp. TaxID=2493630 RepID=UPI003A84B9D6